jgi:hypothetical protein
MYDGSLAAPTNPGSYGVSASLNHPDYVALDALGTLVLLAPTPPGNNVVTTSTVGTSTISTDFGHVTASGTTTVTAIAPAAAGETPGGFQISGSSLAFDVSSTATYSGTITICFTLPSITDEVQFNGLRVLHREAVTAQGVTTYQLIDRTVLNGADRPDFATKRICARTSSLSPFVVATVTDLAGPSLIELALSLNPTPLGSAVNLTATVSDVASGGTNIGLVEYSVDGGVAWQPVAAEYNTTPALTVTAPLALPVGVYNICVRGTDGAQNTTTSCGPILAVYDPDGGFVTGGGWITSPAGAYAPDESLTGKATFGFVSRYHQGSATPGGNTQFQFHAASLTFRSTSYEWLVVAGARAQFKGTGTINGAGTYQFLLTAMDGQRPGGGGADALRMKITGADGGLIYDNKMGSSDVGDDATVLGGGSILIHP